MKETKHRHFGAKIIEKDFLGTPIYTLELPKGFKLNWAYFHKAFRQMDGKNEKEQKLINKFYEAYAELPDECLECAEDNLLELQYDEDEK